MRKTTLSPRRTCLICVISGLLLAQGTARAQVATGLPAFGSFSGGPDVVNNANLNVHLTIPIVSKAGVGLPFDYVLTYDSAIWTSSGTWTPASNWGWKGVTEALTGYATYRQNLVHCTMPPQSPAGPLISNYYYYTYDHWTYHDASGGTHSFPNIVLNTESTNFNICQITGVYSGTDTTTDGTGYTVTATINTDVPASAFGATVYGVGGTTINPPVGTSPGPWTVTDTNGNTLTTNTSSGTTTFTDTLGYTALTVSGSGTPSSPMVYNYTAAGNHAENVKVYYTTYTVRTNFGCGVGEFAPTSENLVSEIDLADINTNPSDKYTFAYEPTPGFSGDYTGRIASITLPTGGTITYSYSGGNNGITCADGSTATLQRYTPDSGANYWKYQHTESGSAWTTTVTDPQSNTTTINFCGIYETSRTLPGSLGSVSTAYNSSCGSSGLSFPITQRTAQTTLNGGTSMTNEVNTTYNLYGLPTETDEYDWGSSGPGAILRKTVTKYNTDMSCGVGSGNGIVNRPCTITIENGSGGAVATTTDNYDTRGNLLSTATGNLTKSFTYYGNGTVNVATDVNGAPTTYSYNGSGGCNSAFPTSVSEPMSLSRSMTWDCYAGLMTSLTDENNKMTSFAYADPLNRVTSVTDPSSAVTNYSYATSNPLWSESALNFNGTTSTSDSRTTVDGLGRVHVSQTRQAQGSSNYDSVETVYDALGRPSRVTMPYSGTAGQTNSSGPATNTTYDALGRPLTITDGGNGTATFSYNENDVKKTVTPAPTGENTKSWQYEYDGLGRLTSVCEITSATGSGSCGQHTTASGYLTTYSYDALNNLASVSQSGQSRSFTYDALGRLSSETNPESGTTAYVFDTVSGNCAATYNGDLVRKTDAVGNATCFTYDLGHRLLTVTYPSTDPYYSVTPSKTFVYDTATVNGNNMLNAHGHLAEAFTGPSGSKITDLGFSYTARGEASVVYESTPHSSGYYHVSGSYWANGLLNTLTPNITGLPTAFYCPEGEGRPSSVSTASSCATTNYLASGTQYNVSGGPTGVTLGSNDSDAFTYDPNTGRMTQYKFTVNSSSVIGNLTWNANGTLQTLAITDPFNSSNQQTCTYGYDDLVRIASVGCGTKWGQTFSFSGGGQTTGAFGNLTKTGSNGGITFNPNYSSTTNRITSVGGQNYTYDGNGNLTSTGTGTGTGSYTWDADGHMATDSQNGSTSVTMTYDALGRAVEQARGASYTEIVYGTGGGKLALMSGQTLTKAFVPLPAGGTAVYTSSGLAYYRHADWLGSSRFASTPSRTKYYDAAYAPFGEPYAESGTTDRNFTGQNQDTTPNLYDFLFREHDYTQGRWMSPDPLGGDVTNPQSLNRYAYVLNNPCSLMDPFGLSSACSINVAIAKGVLTSSQLAGAVAEFTRALGDAGITVNVVKGNQSPVYLLNFATAPANMRCTPWGPDSVGCTFPSSDPTAYANVGNVYSNNIASEMASVGVGSTDPRYGLALGSVAAHEFGHYAGNLSDVEGGADVMGPFDPLDFKHNAHFDFTDDDVPKVQSICNRLNQGNRAGLGGSGGASGSGGISWLEQLFLNNPAAFFGGGGSSVSVTYTIGCPKGYKPDGSGGCVPAE